MATTNFPSPVNGAESALAVNYTAGSGFMTLAKGYGAVINQKLAQLGLPSISASSPLPYTITSNVYPTYGSAIYRATGLTGDKLTGVSVAEGTVDQFFGAGSAFNIYPTAGQIALIQSTIVALQTIQPIIISAPYITQTPVATLTGSQALSTLATGLLKNTTASGVLSIGDAGVDYIDPTGVAGGQTAYGGVNANDNFTLNSTSNAVKGLVLIGNDGSFVGINTPNPQRSFQVTGVSTFARLQSTTNAASHNLLELFGSGLTANGNSFNLAFIATDNAAVTRTFGAFGIIIDDINSATYSGSVQIRAPGNGALGTYIAKFVGNGGHLLPQGTLGTQSLGSTSNRWALACSNLDISGTITGTLNATLADQGGQVYNVRSTLFGAKGNCLTLADGAMSSSSNPTFLSSASANFTAADVGKSISIIGAGAAGATLAASITAFQSATVVTLSQSCQTTVSAATFQYGHNDVTAIQNAINAAATLGGKVLLPAGTYLLTTVLNVPSNVIIEGVGTGTVIQMSLGLSGGTNAAMLQMIGSSGLLSNIIVRDLVLDSQGGSRASNNSIGFQILLSNAERCTIEGVTFRAHGYGVIGTDMPTNPCLFMPAKDFSTDLGDLPGGPTDYPSVLVGPSQYHTVRRCTFEGTSTAQFAVRVMSDWVNRRAPLTFTNYAEGNVFEDCIFTGSYGWNVLEIAGGGTRFNIVRGCRYKGVQATLTCIDFDKGCSYNIAIGNIIEGATKTSYYIGVAADRLTIINDHGIPASDPLGAYYSQANRVIGNTIGPIDTPSTTDTLESALGISASIRSLVEGNAIASVNLSAGNGNGIVFSECAQATIANNHIQGVNHGIISDGSATSRYAMLVTGNQIESAAQSIDFQGGTAGSGNAPKGVVISGNRCNNAGTTLPVIYVGLEVTAPVISGNQCIGGNDGITCNTTGSVVTGNDCQNNAVDAIRVYNDATITGNRNSGAANDVLFSGTVSSSTPLVLAGNHFTTVRSKSAAYTMTVADEFVQINATANTFQVTLIDARLIPGQTRKVVKTDSSGNAVTVASVNNQTINGVNATTSPISLGTQWKVAVLTSDGSNWIQQ